MPAPAKSLPGPFDVILFDVGGVLLTNGWDHIERAFVLDQFGLDHAEFETRHAVPYDLWERGAISAEEYLAATVFYEPRGFTPQEFIAAMKVQSKLLPDNALGILGEVCASGNWLVGVLNNESRLLHEYRLEQFEIGTYLDLQLSSCYLGLRKPEAAIYRRALDIVGVPGERVVFIDDRKVNTEAAAAVEMHAIQFVGEERLRGDLKELGIL